MRPLSTMAIATLTAFTFCAAGCNGDIGTSHLPGNPPSTGGGSGPGTAPNPDNPTPAPSPTPAPQPVFSGVYEVSAPLDFTQNGVLPGLLGPALSGLSELHDHPGDAILTIAKGANIPVVSGILNKIPSFLESVLAGLLDKLIIDNVYNGSPVVDQITNIIMGITELSKKIDVQDQLTIHAPGANGQATVDEKLTAVTFTLLGKQQMVTFTTGKTVQSSATITPLANGYADADLSLGAAQLSLPIGDLLLQAAGPLLFSQFGGAKDLGGALKNLVPCSSFAQTLSDGLGGIISVSEADALCQGALGAVASIVEQKIKAVTFDSIKVDGGQGKLYDQSQSSPQYDYQSDRIAEGKWTWQFAVNGSTIGVPSTFAGDRTGTAN